MKHDLSKKAVLKSLPPRIDPYFHKLAKGLYVGIRKTLSGSESWIARVKVKDGYRTQVLQVDTFTQAVEEAGLYAKLVRDGDAPTKEEIAEQAKGNMTVAALIELFLDSDEKRLEKGEGYVKYKAKETSLSAKYILPNLGHIKLRSLTAKQIKANQTEQGLRVRAETVNRSDVTFRAALAYALRQGWITTPIWQEVKKLKEAEPHDKARSKVYFLREHRDAIYKAADEALKPILKCMDITGCRPSEARRLRVRDVHDDYLYLFTNKGGGNSRRFPLKNGRLAFFQEQAQGRDEDEWLFVTQTGVQWEMANLAKGIDKIKADESAGNNFTAINKKAKPKSKLKDFESMCYRHSFITDCIKAGMSPVYVARIVGNSLEYIEKNYTLGLDLSDMLEDI